MDREEDCYLRAVAETLSEWNSPEDEDAWRDEKPDIQRAASEQEPTGPNLGSSVRARSAPLGGVELDLPRREPMREPPGLSSGVGDEEAPREQS